MPQSQANRHPGSKLSSVISNPNLISNRSNSTPSPSNQSAARTASQPNIKLPETYYHVNVAQLKSKFDANAQDQKANTNSNLNVKTLDKKSPESSFQLEKENRGVLKQLQVKRDPAAKETGESPAHETFGRLSGEQELNRSSDYHINNFQTEQLEVLQKETERIEFEKNTIANNISETDLKIAKCRQKIQVLMDEIKGKRPSRLARFEESDFLAETLELTRSDFL